VILLRHVPPGTEPKPCPACGAPLYRVTDSKGRVELVECTGTGARPPTDAKSGLGRKHTPCSWDLFSPAPAS